MTCECLRWRRTIIDELVWYGDREELVDLGLGGEICLWLELGLELLPYSSYGIE